MDIVRYLPSAKLVSIVFSLALSAGLVFAADKITHRTSASGNVGVDSNAPSASADWEASLAAIQAQNASSAFVTPDPNFVENLLQAAQSPNVTDTVGKTLLINLSNAKSQGLGSDIPTQEQIIAAAAAQIKQGQTSSSNYTTADLTIVAVSDIAMRAYGNGVMRVLSKYPEASERATLLAIDYAVEAGDKTQGAKLATIGAAYKNAAKALVALPVPQTLAPFHLAMVNNLLSINATYADMQVIDSDPVRGLVGLQTYQALMDSGARIFTNVAQQLSKDGILFSKDEPGAAWSVFVSQ